METSSRPRLLNAERWGFVSWILATMKSLIICLIFPFIIPPSSFAEIYKCVDDNGKILFTTKPGPNCTLVQGSVKKEPERSSSPVNEPYNIPPKSGDTKYKGGYSASPWALYEETSIDGLTKGITKKGRLFKTRSGHIYEVIDYIAISVVIANPNVIVLSNGTFYKLIIDGFDQPLRCKCLNCRSHVSPQPMLTSDIIESRIDGDFEGWEGETIVRLMNGQIWQQVEYFYEYHYAYMPEVLIYLSNGAYKMKVDGIETAVGVVQVK